MKVTSSWYSCAKSRCFQINKLWWSEGHCLPWHVLSYSKKMESSHATSTSSNGYNNDQFTNASVFNTDFCSSPCIALSSCREWPDWNSNVTLALGIYITRRCQLSMLSCVCMSMYMYLFSMSTHVNASSIQVNMSSQYTFSKCQPVPLSSEHGGTCLLSVHLLNCQHVSVPSTYRWACLPVYHLKCLQVSLLYCCMAAYTFWLHIFSTSTSEYAFPSYLFSM